MIYLVMAGTKIKAKAKKVMREFKEGKLKSSNGRKVTELKQALAIAFSEQRKANRKYG